MRITGRTTSHGQLGGVGVDDHHIQVHAPESHSDTDITGAQLETLSDTSDADALHAHALLALASALHDAAHTAASHSDQGATGAELETLTDGSDADLLHAHATLALASELHAEAHTAASHSDQGATGAELETLTDASDADALHTHDLKAEVSALHTQVHGNADHDAEVHIMKTADEEVASSITLQNDNHFTFAILANEDWELTFELWGDYQNGIGIRFKVIAPSGAVGKMASWLYRDDTLEEAEIITTLGETTYGPVSNATYLRVKVTVENAGNAGNVIFQWAQNTSSVTVTKILKNATMTAHRLT